MTLETGKQLNILQACWVGEYSLEVEFNDGFSRNVDFEPFLSASVQPVIRKYLDVERFKGFSISFGNLVWNDYDLCFPIEHLYSDRLLVGQESRSLVAEGAPGYGAHED